MGADISKLAVTKIPDAYIAISICANSKIRIMNVTPEVRELLERLDQEITEKSGSTRGPLVEYFGTLKIHVGDRATFEEGGGKDRSTLGKFFALRLLEEMYNLGYNPVTSSELATQYDKSTLFFAKSTHGTRGRARICCIAPGGVQNNKLVLLHHDEHIKQAVMLAVGFAWPGSSGAEDVSAAGEVLHEISLSGHWGHTHEDGINTRRAVCSLVGNMSALNWRLLASSNLKGAADSFFFIYDQTFSAHPKDFCMLTLAKMDRFRLINCDQLLGPLETAIAGAGLVIQEKLDYYGSHEIKIKGNPWRSDNSEAIAARRSISRIMEVFGQNGYSPLYGIDVSRGVTDKSSILFQKTPNPVNCKYACLALTDTNRLALLDFPTDVSAAMKDCIQQFYPSGIRNEVQLPDSNIQVDVQGDPWMAVGFAKGGARFHMRAVLGKMMAVAAQLGWHVSISADVSSKFIKDRTIDVHSLYFTKTQ